MDFYAKFVWIGGDDVIPEGFPDEVLGFVDLLVVTTECDQYCVSFSKKRTLKD